VLPVALHGLPPCTPILGSTAYAEVCVALRIETYTLKRRDCPIKIQNLRKLRLFLCKTSVFAAALDRREAATSWGRFLG